MSIAIISPGDRTHIITNPLDTTDIIYEVNPQKPRNFDFVICDTPDRSMLKEVLKHKFRNNILLFRMRGDPYWGINEWMDSKIKQKIALEMLSHVDGCVAIAHHQAKKYWEKTKIPTEIVQIGKEVTEWPHRNHSEDYLKILTLTNAMYPNKVNPIIDIIPEINQFLKNNGGIWNICGNGKYEDTLEKATRETENVNFLGYQNAYNQLSRSNLYLHPSDFDSYANAILEGMASNLPVIASNHPSFVNPDWPIDIFSDSYELEKYLKRYRHPKERTYAGRHNHNWVIRNASLEEIGRNWKDALKYFRLLETDFKTGYEVINNE